MREMKREPAECLLELFQKVENCFIVSRESAFNVEFGFFLKSKTDSFQTKNRFSQIKKLALHKSKLDSSQINSVPQ